MSDIRKDLYKEIWQETQRSRRLLSDLLEQSFLKKKLKTEME